MWYACSYNEDDVADESWYTENVSLLRDYACDECASNKYLLYCEEIYTAPDLPILPPIRIILAPSHPFSPPADSQNSSPISAYIFFHTPPMVNFPRSIWAGQTMIVEMRDT